MGHLLVHTYLACAKTNLLTHFPPQQIVCNILISSVNSDSSLSKVWSVFYPLFLESVRVVLYFSQKNSGNFDVSKNSAAKLIHHDELQRCSELTAIGDISGSVLFTRYNTIGNAIYNESALFFRSYPQQKDNRNFGGKFGENSPSFEE